MRRGSFFPLIEIDYGSQTVISGRNDMLLIFENFLQKQLKCQDSSAAVSLKRPCDIKIERHSLMLSIMASKGEIKNSPLFLEFLWYHHNFYTFPTNLSNCSQTTHSKGVRESMKLSSNIKPFRGSAGKNMNAFLSNDFKYKFFTCSIKQDFFSGFDEFFAASWAFLAGHSKSFFLFELGCL